MKCRFCSGLMYEDEDIYTCYNCGRHVYSRIQEVITYGPKNVRRTEGGRKILKHLEQIKGS